MANQPKVSTENNFTGGLKTEFTGLNFPENACTDVDNCVFSLIGNVTRRPGFDYETNYALTAVDRTGKAISTYKWNNAGGDGLTQIIVEQVGNTLSFYTSSAATIASPLSTKKLTSTVDISTFLATGSSNVSSIVECQFSDGNGYLFVYHPYLDSFYCTYTAGVITANIITVQTRDFTGFPEVGVPVNFRPLSLTVEHNYNLQNQGWTNAPLWTATSTTQNSTSSGATTWTMTTGSHTFTVASGLSITGGQAANLTCSIIFNATNGQVLSTGFTAVGTVTSYSGTTLVINVSSSNSTTTTPSASEVSETWNLSSSNLINLISTWQSAIGNYPSNSDIWWSFKNSSDVFAPGTTISNVAQASAPATGGHFIVNAFNQQQTVVSGITGLTSLTTIIRPKTGTWFQGRVWYAGVDASQAPTGDQPFYTWTESIYFSQIITDSTQFGMCYQTNDPTDENLFTELPSDGGVIQIQGCGSIYKLFPIQNGMLVFAANGIWFITGSQGIGFTANDYTITKISSVQSISCTSFVNVQGLPIFWNEEGIYTVEPAQQGLGLTVNPITVGTILSFYAAIPLQSKKFVRGDYHPLDYIVKWVYRSTNESSVTDRYQFDSILNLNTYTKAFYPYNLTGTPHIHGVNYVAGPGGTTSPDPAFKFVTSVANGATYQFTFSEENDLDYVDWYSFDNTGVNFNSYFITGYKLHGQALRQWQPEYVYMYSRNDTPTSYKIQGIWNYASNGNSGKYSSVQLITNDVDNFGTIARRHRIRGHGTSFQLKISSVNNQPFDIIGWAIYENINAGV